MTLTILNNKVPFHQDSFGIFTHQDSSTVELDFSTISQKEAEAQDPEIEATFQNPNSNTESNFKNQHLNIDMADRVISQEDAAQAQDQEMEAPDHGPNITKGTYSFFDIDALTWVTCTFYDPAPTEGELPQYASDTTTQIYVQYPVIENVPTKAIVCGPENKDCHQEGSPNFHRGNLVYYQVIGAFWPERQACQPFKEQTTLNTRILEEIKGPFLIPCKENDNMCLPPLHAPRGQEGWYYLMTFKWARNKVNQSFIDGTAKRVYRSQQNNGN
jgi:hypothetical protein